MLFFVRILKRYSAKKLLLFAADFVVLVCGTTLALTLKLSREGGIIIVNPLGSYRKDAIYLLVIACALLFFRYFNLYKQRVYHSLMEQFIQVLKALMLSAMIVVVLNFFIVDIGIRSNARFSLVCYVVINVILVTLYRSISLKFIKSSLDSKLLQRRVLAIGAGDVGIKFVKESQSHPQYHLDVVGFLDDKEELQGTFVEAKPILGKIDDLDAIVEEYSVDEIFITIENISYDELMRLIERAKETGTQVNLVSSHFDIIKRKVDVMEFNGITATPIYSQIANFYPRFLKRVFDILITLSILAAGSPIFLLMGILVKMSSGGPIFYKSLVIGKNWKTCSSCALIHATIRSIGASRSAARRSPACACPRRSPRGNCSRSP